MYSLSFDPHPHLPWGHVGTIHKCEESDRLDEVEGAMPGPRSIAKLVNNSKFTMVYGTCNYS